MRQKTFIKQTSLAILLYFICLALAVTIDLIFFKVKNMYHTPALAAIFAGWVYLGLIRKTKQFGAITCLGIFMSLFFQKKYKKFEFSSEYKKAEVYFNSDSFYSASYASSLPQIPFSSRKSLVLIRYFSIIFTGL